MSIAKLLGLSFAASMLASTPVMAQSPVIIPGGAMDTSIAGIDAYIGQPAAADPGDNPACRAAKAYFDMEGQGRYGDLDTLFVPDAVFLDPLRMSTAGRLDIGDFYKNHVSKINPSIITVSYAGHGMDCYVETSVRMTIKGQPRWVFSAIDQFTVNTAGKITRFIVFLRPPPRIAAPMAGASKAEPSK